MQSAAQTPGKWPALAVGLVGAAVFGIAALTSLHAAAQTAPPSRQPVDSRIAPGAPSDEPRSPDYARVQAALAQGWNTWDARSVTTHVLLPDAVAIHVGLEHNSSELVDSFLSDALIGRLPKNAEKIIPGPHTWDGSYTDLTLTWRGDTVRVQSAHDGADLVLLVTPVESLHRSALPPSVVFSVDRLWNRPGTVARLPGSIEAHTSAHIVEVYCALSNQSTPCGTDQAPLFGVNGAYFAADLRAPVGLSTGRRRTVAEIASILARQRKAYDDAIAQAGKSGPMVDVIQTILGWNTTYDAENRRVITPVSRGWSTGWGGFVLFDWDTFFAATLASVGDRNLAYANALEMLRDETPAGFVPNFSRPDGWKSFDRSEPPVGAISVLTIYNKFHERWFLNDAFTPLLLWNRWWAEHRDRDGYLTWGSDGENQPVNLDDTSVGKRDGAVLESGLDNSPMYDHVVYDPKTHQLEFADVGLMSMYIADCDALAKIANVLGKTAEEKELREHSRRYRDKLATMWDDKAGIFLNKDLHTGSNQFTLSPTNFYPLMARAATPAQAQRMIHEHLLNSAEFWGTWVIPSIMRTDPAFDSQNYWRGRIWGPMNYLVYLGLRNYDDPKTRADFASKSWELLQQEWKANGHIHENYNAVTGMADDVDGSDRFYHWGALLALIEYTEQTEPAPQPVH